MMIKLMMKTGFSFLLEGLAGFPLFSVPVRHLLKAYLVLMIMLDFFLIFKIFFQIKTEYFKALVASPQTEHHYAQYYLFHQLWFGIGKLYQEERRQDSNLRSCRKKISIDHVCSTSLAKIPQLVTEYATYVMTWNKSLFLSLCPRPHSSERHISGWTRLYLAVVWYGVDYKYNV